MGEKRFKTMEMFIQCYQHEKADVALKKIKIYRAFFGAIARNFDSILRFTMGSSTEMFSITFNEGEKESKVEVNLEKYVILFEDGKKTYTKSSVFRKPKTENFGLGSVHGN